MVKLCGWRCAKTIKRPPSKPFQSIHKEATIKIAQIYRHPLSFLIISLLSSSAIILSDENEKWWKLTVNSPVTASKPTCTVCSKFVGYEMFGLESLCDCFDLILLLRVFFLRSGSSGSVDERMEFIGKSSVEDEKSIGNNFPFDFNYALRASVPLGSGFRSGGPSSLSVPPRLLVSRTGGAGGLSSSLDMPLLPCFVNYFSVFAAHSVSAASTYLSDLFLMLTR